VAVYWPLLALDGGAVPSWVVTAWGQAVACAAGVAALARPLLVREDRWQWALLGLGILALGIGDAVWAAIGEPELSAVDGLYLVALAALHVGLIGLVHSHVTRATGVMLLDAASAGLALAAVGVAVVVPWAMAGADGGLAVAVNLAYPLWDVALVASAVGAVALSGWRPGRDALGLMAGFGLMVLADAAYVAGITHGVLGSLSEVLWPLAYAVIGLSGWLPSRVARPRPGGSWRTLVVPAALGVTALAVLVTAGFRPVSGVAVVLAAAAVLAVLARGALQFIDGWALERDLEAAERLAARDPLTGLLNHRAFQERLAHESARAARAGEPMALVLIDIDHFKAVNDGHGHQAGDEVLREVAVRLTDMARQEDVLARIGGEEFAWLLPGADDLAAWDAAERARHSVRSSDIPPAGRVTVSGGVADMRHARDASELVRLADGALYWAKAHGRDVVFRYSTDVVRALSAEERAGQLMRAQALNAMRVLARAVDARDPYTAAHSERVADLCVRLATVLNWPSERIVALREAALVHDVGKIGVPDAILLKAAGLTDAERLQIEGHAALGAQIVADVLTNEQASWVRGHHERFDGAGYPDMLAGRDIPDGARIMTVADSWDAMTTDRPYRLGLPVAEALARVLAGRGTQFCPEVVEAMGLLSEHGLLEPAGAVRLRAHRSRRRIVPDGEPGLDRRQPGPKTPGRRPGRADRRGGSGCHSRSGATGTATRTPPSGCSRGSSPNARRRPPTVPTTASATASGSATGRCVPAATGSRTPCRATASGPGTSCPRCCRTWSRTWRSGSGSLPPGPPSAPSTPRTGATSCRGRSTCRNHG